MKSLRFRVFTFLGLALLLVLTITSYSREEAPKSEKKKIESSTPVVQQPRVTLPTYSVLDEDIYDTAIKTQVVLNILVSGEISEPGLRALLDMLYSSIRARGGFKYYNPPTNVFIYAFTSKERAESGWLWVAMLQKIYDDVKPTISINERQIAQLGAKPEEKFGLSEAKRKQIWRELIEAERLATRIADRTHPLPDVLKHGYSQFETKRQIRKQNELWDKLRDEYKKEIAKEYGLTRKQLDEITTEAFAEDWPFPK